ncbi:hypothetical protein PMAYCL1PPCAC_15369, partial [Pristionchus mayeri]
FHSVFVFNGEHNSFSFTVPLRYSNLQFLNGGSQGLVVSADDSSTRKRVAIKKMHQPFVMPISAKRAYREFVLLSSVKHPNDLKPSNIVVNENCKLKVLDFGLARLINPTVSDRKTAYVTTRYYRAPEVVLGLPYDEKVDVWSIGCIFAELINQRVLFPGMDKVKQWNEIVKIMGTPSEEFFSSLDLAKPVADYVRSLPLSHPCSIEEVVPDRHFLANTEHQHSLLTADEARSLISKMLKMDPSERCSVAEALEHPYVRRWRREEEVNAPQSSNKYNWEFAEVEQSLPALNAIIFEEVKRFESSHD